MSGMMPPGWTAHQNPDGRYYYHHGPTNTTQWHPPAAEGGAGAAAPAPPSTEERGKHGKHSQQQQQPQAASSQFVFQQPMEFKLQEKVFSLSGDGFKIKRLDTGDAFFKVKGNALSLKDSKTLSDMNGAALYKMTENLLTLRGRMHITQPGASEPVITLRKKGFIPMFGTSTIQAWRGGSDDGDPWLEVKGDFFRKDFTVTEKATGRTAATIKRKSATWQNVMFEKDSYVIRIEPGYDTALLVFFVIAADEQYRDDGERRGYSSLF